MLVQENITQAVSLDEFKRSRHIIESDDMDDALIESYLAAAQSVVETGTNRPLTPRVAQIDCRATGFYRWWLPCAPVRDVTNIEVQSDGVWSDLDISGVWVEQAYDEPQLVLPAGFWDGVADGAAVRVTASVGYDVAPLPLRQAIILIAGDWYEAGIDPDKDANTKVSFGSRVLMNQGKYQRPQEWARA